MKQIINNIDRDINRLNETRGELNKAKENLKSSAGRCSKKLKELKKILT